MEDLVTVVVAIYNTEKYLKRCIDSILRQTYKNLQIILVDDGSTDMSSIICDEYSRLYSNILVIHKINGGLSDARNKGIDAATGKYVALIDSDDYINENYILKLYNLCREYNADIAQCSYTMVYNSDDQVVHNKTNVEQNKKTNKSLSGKEAVISSFSEFDVQSTVAWNKLYKKDLFNYYRYPYAKIHEDEFTTYKLLYISNIVSYIDEPLYYYYKSTDSITTRKYNLKRLDVIEAMEEKLKFFLEKNEEKLYNLTLKQYYFVLLNSKYDVEKHIDDSSDKKRVLKNIRCKLEDIYNKIIKSKDFKLKYKIKITISKIFPKLSISVFRKLIISRRES
ncbi:MAG: glycosyltransferase [Clostridia bacterium]|nr:glycosyltransferase [Clostridia bacterium]